MADHADEVIVADETPGYQPPAQKSVEEILKADAEDESLRKYKEALLGTADPTLLEVCKLHREIKFACVDIIIKLTAFYEF